MIEEGGGSGERGIRGGWVEYEIEEKTNGKKKK